MVKATQLLSEEPLFKIDAVEWNKNVKILTSGKAGQNFTGLKLKIQTDKTFDNLHTIANADFWAPLKSAPL